jgi:hypothetical protein
MKEMVPPQRQDPGLPPEPENPAHELDGSADVHRHFDSAAGRPPEPLAGMPLPALDVRRHLGVEEDSDASGLASDP